MTRFSAAFAALGLLTLPVASFAGTTAEREPVSVRVSTQGLDVDTPDGLAKLRHRTARAITAACSSGERLKTSLSPDWQCRKELAFDASAKASELGSKRRFFAQR